MMRRWFIIGICFISVAGIMTIVNAETMYVIDVTEITMRTGPGIEHKIIAMPKSGQTVEVEKFGDAWSFVRLPDGKEGWVLSRYLTSEIPNILELERLRKKHESLSNEAAELTRENSKLKEENKKLAAELDDKQKKLAELNQSYEALKSESSDFLAIKQNYEDSASQLEQQTQKAEKLEARLSRIQNNENVIWFALGAGVLTVGVFMGLNLSGKRRRSSLL